MEEAKAAAYYEQLVREGEGAAKFKQGLGYSSAGPTDAAPSWGRSSDLSGFVRSSAGGSTDSDAGKEARLSAVKAKLAGKSDSFRESDRPSSARSSRGGDERRTRRSRSRSRSPRRRERSERRRTSRRSLSPERGRRRRRSRSRSSSPRRRSERSRREGGEGRDRSSSGKEKVAAVDYSRLIEGYANMTSAERVKAKMKLQLSQTAAKDKVMGKGWERFEFDKDAPLDDEEIEVADDDANLVKNMDKTFRFSSLEVKRESDLEAAHDQAMFGVPSALPDSEEYEDADGLKDQDTTEKSHYDVNLVSEKVLSMQRGSWRDKVRNQQKG